MWIAPGGDTRRWRREVPHLRRRTQRQISISKKTKKKNRLIMAATINLTSHFLFSFSLLLQQQVATSSDARSLASVVLLLRRYTDRHDFHARVFVGTPQGTNTRNVFLFGNFLPLRVG
jgi:hypothetical protein